MTLSLPEGVPSVLGTHTLRGGWSVRFRFACGLGSGCNCCGCCGRANDGNCDCLCNSSIVGEGFALTTSAVSVGGGSG